MERFREERRVELGQVKTELANLKAKGGAIDLFDNPPDGADAILMKSLERGARKAMLRKAYLEERVETLKMETPEAKKQATEDITAWLEQDYPGGVTAARYDRELRNTTVTMRSFQERARDRRQFVFARERQAVEGMEGLREARAELEAIALEQSVQQRAEKVAVLHRTVERLQRQTTQDMKRVRRQRQVALGLDTTTPFEEIDWNTSTFPERDKRTRVNLGGMTTPQKPQPLPPRRRAGMFPTQPRLPTTPEPPKPPGMEIDM